MVELKGTLNGIGLPALVQLICELRHSGTLQLTGQHASGTLRFDDAGRVVDAEFGEKRGLQAIECCAVDLPNADFTFVEGNFEGDHPLNLGPSEIKRLLTPEPDRHVTEALNDTTAGMPPETRTASACPLLGFADDRTTHYARPTALHRCFAGGNPGLVTPADQRELCLSGTFSTCPRFVGAGSTVAVSAAVANHAQPDVAQPEVSTPRQTPKPPRTRPMIPPTPATASKTAESAEESPPRRTRQMILAGVAAALVVSALLAVVVPRLTDMTDQTPPALDAAETAAVDAVAAADPREPPAAAETQTAPTTAPPTALAGPRPIATTQPPTLAALSRPPTPTGTLAPDLATTAGSLLDVRFTTGGADTWLANAPFGEWSDGAYRMQAREPKQFVAIAAPIAQVMSDVTVTATFRKTGGPPGGGYGIILRAQGPLDGVNQQFNAYVFEAGDRGEYGIWRRDGDEFVDVVPWTPSPIVRTGGSPNDLMVKAVGDQFTFTVNGTDIVGHAIQDDTFDSGRIGVFTGGDYNEVALDHFNVQASD